MSTNYEVTKFQGGGLSFTQDQPTPRRNLLRAPPAPRHEVNPLPQPPHLPNTLDEINDVMRHVSLASLLRHIDFFAYYIADRPNDSGA